MWRFYPRRLGQLRLLKSRALTPPISSSGHRPYTGEMLALLLLLNALFNVIVWPQFYRRINADSRARDSSAKATMFLRVHLAIISIALILAVVSAVVGVLTLIGVW